MPKRIIPALLTACALQAGITDFKTIKEAQNAYQNGDYAAASKLFSEVADKNDEARFNYADALYKSKQYKPAIEQYGTIPGHSALKAKALYNAGNAHAQLGELDKAEQAYTDALKVAKEEALKGDIEHNLDVIRKAQEKQQKQQDKDQKNDQEQQEQKNSDQNRSDQQEQENGQPRDEQNNQQQEQQKPSGGASSSQNSSDAQQGEQSSAEKKDERSEKENQGAAHSVDAEEEPISDMEERKYNQMLDKRGIRTLMVPLNSKGEPRENETTPW